MDNRCPVPMLQNEWEFNQLLCLYKNLNAKTVIEIGSFFGGTLWHWINSNPSLQNIHTIDFPIPKSDHRYYQMIECRNQWTLWTEGLNHYDIKDLSQKESVISKVKKNLNGELADFLFIDGSHEYKDVRMDFQNYYVFVREGGLIALHDIFYSKGVSMFWEELKSVSGHNIIEIKGGSRIGLGEYFGIGIICK